MKELIYWYCSLSMEEIFILTGICVLLIGTGLGLLGDFLVDRPKRKIKQDTPQESEEEPCGTCLRWSECNGVDEDCPRRGDDGK